MTFIDPSIVKCRRMFRYDCRLNSNEEAKHVIRESWSSSQTKQISERLTSARQALAEWNRLQHHNSRELIEQKQRELEEALTSPVNDTALIQEINSKLNEAYLAEEAFWKQRSRLLWLKLGDRNSGFFHAATKK